MDFPSHDFKELAEHINLRAMPLNQQAMIEQIFTGAYTCAIENVMQAWQVQPAHKFKDYLVEVRAELAASKLKLDKIVDELKRQEDTKSNGAV